MRRMNHAFVVQSAAKTAIDLPIIPFGWLRGVLVALVIACPGSLSVGTNEKTGAR